MPPSSPIIGGQNAEEGEFKYIVSLRLQADPNTHGGAGSLISDRWILTARHTLMESVLDSRTRKVRFTLAYSVTAAPQYYNDMRKFVNLTKYDAEKTFCHPVPDFPGPSSVLDGDIGLMKLKKAIPLGSQSPYNFQTIPMIKNPSEVNWNDPVKLAGWGQYRIGIPGASNFLLKTDIETYLFDTCENVIPLFRKDLEFCAYEFGKSACFLDSGGPGVFKKIGTSNFILAGIISYGIENCT